MINQIKQVVKIPVIAMGGISCLSDLIEFMAVGADAFQIGTQNFITPSICSDLAIELKEYIEKNGFKDFDDLKGAILNG
jgi:dihydroorotate dehydrogenase (NAD+) catalytic subunit